LIPGHSKLARLRNHSRRRQVVVHRHQWLPRAPFHPTRPLSRSHQLPWATSLLPPPLQRRRQPLSVLLTRMSSRSLPLHHLGLVICPPSHLCIALVLLHRGPAVLLLAPAKSNRRPFSLRPAYSVSHPANPHRKPPTPQQHRLLLRRHKHITRAISSMCRPW
jgi:hypothetical protein